MNAELLDRLSIITPEEREILDGRGDIDKRLYTDNEKMIVESEMLLDAGKLITVRPHTRFIHFPLHTHNYIEMVYMCSGSTTHIINGGEVLLKKGEILLLNKNASHEILPAMQDDVAINFIILPQFFDRTLQLMGDEQNLIRDFLVDCLKSSGSEVGYLHFKVAEVLPIQNLVENLIWTLVNDQVNKRSINQYTMAVLFLQLMNHTDKISSGGSFSEREFDLTVLRYIEENYRGGELTDLAGEMHYDVYWLSREIKKRLGGNFTELVQIKRLNHAAFLLANTALSVSEIAAYVGYENSSYFYRIFAKKFGVTPKKYRDSRAAPNSSAE